MRHLLKTPDHARRGFTLVEAAIVVLIVGLMIGAAMKVKLMIGRANVAATVMQVQAVQTALGTFRDTYQALPGDMKSADTRIDGCNAACQNNAPHAGDGAVGSPAWDMVSFQSASIANAPNTTDAGETVTFWYELSQAKLGISGITADGVTGVAASFGGSLPKAPKTGGFLAGYSDGLQTGATAGRPAVAGPINMTGTVLALTAVPAALSTTAGAQALTPSEAMQIDRKLDDGLPNTGNVQAFGMTASCYGAAAPFAYNETVVTKDCGLYFLVAPANAGVITATVGTVLITHADGTQAAAVVNMPVYQGDVVVTSSGSAAAVQFTDNSVISLGEKSSTTISQYSYSASAQSGQSILSVLRGVFLYTSGLIGTNDPANVTVNTPTASIGIRGTVFSGNVQPVGLPSTFVVLEGAIAVTTAGGTQVITSGTANNFVTTSSNQTSPIMGGTITSSTFYNMFQSFSLTSGTTTGGTATYPSTNYYAGQQTLPIIGQGTIAVP